MSDSIYVGRRVQSFETSPRFAEYDMVVLNLDDDNYVSSPYVTVDDSLWSEATNGKHTFVYDGTAWSYNGSTYTTAQILSEYGLTVTYSSATGVKEGDTITVSKTTSDGTATVTASLTRSGQVLECDCPLVAPSQRQTVADALLAKVIGYSYQPYQAGGARINPAAELGDAMTSYGTYGGIYQQNITFNRLMASTIGAPAKEEEDDELAYESETERRYSRRFADIAAELTIQSDSISAKVSKTGGSASSFAWELEEDHFSVISNGNTMLYIDSTGSTFAGVVKANSIAAGAITIAGQSVNAGYITGSQIGNYTISGGYGGNIGWDTVDYSNTGFQVTLDLVDTNASNISSLSARIGSLESTWGDFDGISVNNWFTVYGYDVRWSTVNGVWVLARDSS